MTEIWGLVLLFISMVVQVIIPPLPAELIVISAGNYYGVLLTTIVSGTGLYLGSFLAYLIGYYIKNRFERFFNRRRINKIIERIEFYRHWILWIRILPYNPSDSISYAAGIIHIKRRSFLVITFFTSYIRCFILSYFGAYVSDVEQIFHVCVFLLFSAVLAHLLLYRYKASTDKKVEDQS